MAHRGGSFKGKVLHEKEGWTVRFEAGRPPEPRAAGNHPELEMERAAVADGQLDLRL
jgi:hypothetical protein